MVIIQCLILGVQCILLFTCPAHADAYPFNTLDCALQVASLQFQRPTSNIELCELDQNFVLKTNNVQLRMNKTLFVCIAKLNFNGNLSAKTYTTDGIRQWFLWDIEKFVPHKPNNWIPGKVSSCGDSKYFYLGGPCVLGPGRVNRIFNTLPPHNQIRITGRLHFFDKWEGEGISIKADGVTLHTEHHNWCPTVMDTTCKKFGIDTCGADYPDKLSVYFDVMMEHDKSQLALEFSSGLKEDACTASWGLDDVALYLR